MGFYASGLQKKKKEKNIFDTTSIWMWYLYDVDSLKKQIFFSICVFFYKHSRITGQQGKEEGVSLIISRTITAEGSPLCIISDHTLVGNLRLPIASR